MTPIPPDNNNTNALSPPQRQLVALMRRLGFGRIDGLEVRDGEPVLHPPPRVTRDIKLGVEKAATGPDDDDEFELKIQVIELLDQMKAMRNGCIETLEVRHGLPFRLTVAASV